MYAGKTLFAQLMDFLPWRSFELCVQRYRGDHRARALTCAEQFRVMAFAQLTYRESLRDIETFTRQSTLLGIIDAHANAVSALRNLRGSEELLQFAQAAFDSSRRRYVTPRTARSGMPLVRKSISIFVCDSPSAPTLEPSHAQRRPLIAHNRSMP